MGSRKKGDLPDRATYLDELVVGLVTNDRGHILFAGAVRVHIKVHNLALRVLLDEADAHMRGAAVARKKERKTGKVSLESRGFLASWRSNSHESRATSNEDVLGLVIVGLGLLLGWHGWCWVADKANSMASVASYRYVFFFLCEYHVTLRNCLFSFSFSSSRSSRSIDSKHAFKINK